MAYTKEFPPNNGDRVAYQDKYGISLGRIIGYDDDYIVVKTRDFGINKVTKIEWSKAMFRHSCPWYLFWQKRR